ncbi:MAG: extracellular solute-binding protein [Phycisphaerales bacterium]|nr:extracellular solute-binding protein [Phycisphaerales bacterium]
MSLQKILILGAMLLVLGVPFAFQPPAAVEPKGAARLVVYTPHNELIRQEFARAFDEWHRARFGRPAVIDWRNPGGTSEIRKQLQSIYSKALANGVFNPDGSLAVKDSDLPDMLFGGGTFEHGQMKDGVKGEHPATKAVVTIPMSVPMGFDQARLDEWFGNNEIGSSRLYDPGQYWLGTAVSGFGIVFNRDVLRRLGLHEPASWEDLADARYATWLALADPRQSGSVATLLESVLNNYGWEKGWRTLRAMAGNSRYFSNSAPKIPIDVSQGQAAAGVAIDFYGRFQSQAVMRPGETPETSRVGYVDPPGLVYIDPDPITILRGGRNLETARHFVEFVMSEEGQALWNFHARGEKPGLGPVKYELRRLPVRRVMYEKHPDRFMDRVNPFQIASANKSRGWRSAVSPMVGAFAIDVHHDCTRAWRALAAAKAPGTPVPPETVARMEELFFSFPAHRTADGRELAFNEANWPEILKDWPARRPRTETLIAYTTFFRDQYRRVIELADQYGIR